MEWTYKGKKFKTEPFNFNLDVNYENILVYHTKWDKCYYLEALGYHGHGSHLKAFITDVYNKDKSCWTDAKWLEKVVEI